MAASFDDNQPPLVSSRVILEIMRLEISRLDEGPVSYHDLISRASVLSASIDPELVATALFEELAARGIGSKPGVEPL